MVEDRISDAEIMERENLRLTLVIGIGGTGKTILTRLRAELIRRYGKVPDLVRLVELDIDPYEEVVRLDSQDIRLQPREFIDLGDVPAADIKRAMLAGKYDQIRAWFDEDTALLEENLRKGGQQNRQLGRLAFFWHLSRKGIDLRKNLEDVISDITRQGRLARHGELDTMAMRGITLDVYVVCSVCGGTGSGMFIDVAYVLQDIFRGRGMSELATVTGVLVTPKVFRAANQQNLRPNAWAALKELNYFMVTPATEKKYPRISYLDKYSVDCRERPFKVCYLLDPIAQDGTNIEGMENFAPMAVDALFVLVGSKLGSQAASQINNVRTLRQPKFGQVFSTFGIASYVFPAEQVETICGTNLAREVVEHYLLRPVADTTKGLVKQETDEFVGRHRLQRPEEFIDRVHRPKGEPVVTPLRQEDSLRRARLEGMKPDDLLGHVTGQVTLLMPRKVEDARSRMKEEAQGLLEALRQDLQGQIENKLNDRNWGIQPALDYLSSLQQRLEQLRSELVLARNREESALKRTEDALTRGKNAFQEAVKRARGVLGVFSDAKKATDQYLAVAQAHLDQQTKVEAYRIAGDEMLPEIVNLVSKRLQEVESLRNILQDLEKTTLSGLRETAWNEIEKLKPARRHSVVGREDVDQLYDQHRDAWLTRLREKVEKEQIQDWLGTSREQLGDRLQKLAKQCTTEIAGIRVEDVIKRKAAAEGKDVSSWVTSLYNRSVVFWTYTKAEADETEKITIIGVEDPENTVCQVTGLGTGCIYAGTGDPHRISILRMEHGLVYDKLSQADQYVQAYETSWLRGDPIHIFPEFTLDGEKARRVFARAYAYGLIRKKGQLYFYHPKTTTRSSSKRKPEPVPLSEKGRGLFNAVWFFVNARDLVQQVEKHVESFEQTTHRDKLMDMLNDFANASEQEQHPDDRLIWKQLCNLAKKWAEDEVRYM